MPWSADNEEINGVIDANLKTSPPNPPAVNTAETVKNLFLAFWSVVSGQMKTAVDYVDESNSSVFINEQKQIMLNLTNLADSCKLAAAISAANAQISEKNAANYSFGTQNAQPSDIPAANIQVYNVATAGTYPNFSGLVVTAADLTSGHVQLRLNGSVWTKLITPIPLTGYTAKTDLQTAKQSIVSNTESGYYNAAGAKLASASFVRTPAPINITAFEWIYYSGQMGGAAPVGICWFNGSTFLSSMKLSPSDGTNQVFSDYAVEKPAGATHATFTFRSDNNVSFSVKANARMYAYKEVTDGIKSKTDQLSSVSRAADTNIVTESETGYYSSAGVKVASSSWYRTPNPIPMPGFPIVTYELYVFLAGATASVVFYDANMAVVTSKNFASMGFTTAGFNTAILNNVLSPSELAVVKFINISSSAVGVQPLPTLKNKSEVLFLASGAELDALKTKNAALETSVADDRYNLAKSYYADRNTTSLNPNPKRIDFIPFGSASWWCYPSCIAIRASENAAVGTANYTFFSYVSTEGEQMIARILEYANDPTGARRQVEHRCVSPVPVYQCDEHNVAAINSLNNNKLIIAAAGHYDKSEVEVRIWDNWKDVKPVIRLKTGGPCSYAQIAPSGSNVLIFTRDQQWRWSFFSSRDNGVTWSACTPFLVGSPGQRAYMRIQKAGSEYLKVYWYPSADERANTFVRYAEINLTTGEVLDKVGGSFLGNIYGAFTPISMYEGGTLLYNNAGIADEVSGGNRRLRLLDVSGNTREEAVFMVATLTGEPSDVAPRNGDYRLITVDLTPSVLAPVSTKLTDYGKEFFQSESDYMGGAFFEQSLSGIRSNTIYLARFGTANTTYNPADAANKFRVEKWVNNSLNTLVEESAQQLFRPFTPQYLTARFGLTNIYMKGPYYSFNYYFSNIILSSV